uniref:Uncharacterized protein n=1 Tax=Oryza rufipogon TaxID=4529 RepID=A0A0E0Q3G9_ORYRU
MQFLMLTNYYLVNQLPLLDERRDLTGVGDGLLDLLEGVLDLLLPLHQPHEPSVPVVAELLDVLQWQEALGEAKFFQQLNGLVPADGISIDDLRAGAVALNLR